MSVAKIERDIKLLQTKLKELDTTTADPIERNEYKKELEKKLKKLQRTKFQTEQLERERQEIESLKSEFTFNGEQPVAIKEYEANYDDTPKIETTSAEQTPSISSQSNSDILIPNNSSKSKHTLAIGGIFSFLFLLGTILVINENKQTQIASHPESQISEPVKIESQSLPSDRSRKTRQNQYLSNSSSYSASTNSYSASTNSNSSSSTSRRNTIQKPISKQEAVNLIDRYLQAKSDILSPPFDRQIASELLTGKALHDIVKPEGTIDWLINNNAYYRYGERRAEPLALFWSNNDRGELDLKIYEEIYFYKNNKLAKSNKYSGDFNFKFQKENGVWKIYDKSSKE